MVFLSLSQPIFLVRFSLVGAEYINEFGNDAENPGKNIPLAMIISTIIVSIIYLGVGFCSYRCTSY